MTTDPCGWQGGPHGSHGDAAMIEVSRPVQALRRRARRGRPVLHGTAGPGDRLPRPERRRQVHDDASHRRAGPADVRHRARSTGTATPHDRAPLTSTWARCSRRRRCTRAAAPTTTCSSSRSPTGSPAQARRRGARAGRPRGASRRSAPRPSRWAWASGSASPARCSATRRSCCSTSRSTAWTPRASSGCAHLLKSLAAEGRAVLVSSHLMAEMALTADHLVVIGRGRLIADTTVADFVAQAGARAGAGAHARRRSRCARRCSSTAAHRHRRRTTAPCTSPASTPRRSGRPPPTPPPSSTS